LGRCTRFDATNPFDAHNVACALVFQKRAIGIDDAITNLGGNTDTLITQPTVRTAILGVAEQSINRRMCDRAVQTCIVRAWILIADRNRGALADDEAKLTFGAGIVKRAAIAIDAAYLTGETGGYAFPVLWGTSPKLTRFA
jgi:hypothetical protein